MYNMDQFNLLDLDTDALNIIGDYVKKKLEENIRIKKKMMHEEQIINGEKIRFRTFDWSIRNRLKMEEDHGPIKIRVLHQKIG